MTNSLEVVAMCPMTNSLEVVAMWPMTKSLEVVVMCPMRNSLEVVAMWPMKNSLELIFVIIFNQNCIYKNSVICIILYILFYIFLEYSNRMRYSNLNGRMNSFLNHKINHIIINPDFMNNFALIFCAKIFHLKNEKNIVKIKIR